jgi:hypothetical protein
MNNPRRIFDTHHWTLSCLPGHNKGGHLNALASSFLYVGSPKAKSEPEGFAVLDLDFVYAAILAVPERTNIEMVSIYVGNDMIIGCRPIAD